MSIGYTVIFLCALGCIGAEAKLNIFFDEVVVETIDPEYFDPEYTDVFVVDDNTISTNWTIVKKLPPETTGTITILGLSLGKYVRPTGLHYSDSLCFMAQEPTLMGSYFESLGITPDACPPEPGNYYNGNFTVGLDSLPDEYPDNKYMLFFEIGLEGKPLFTDKLYFEIQVY